MTDRQIKLNELKDLLDNRGNKSMFPQAVKLNNYFMAIKDDGSCNCTYSSIMKRLADFWLSEGRDEWSEPTGEETV